MLRLGFLLLVATLGLGCFGAPRAGARRYRVPPDKVHGWRCDGTLWYYPETQQLFCDGKMRAVLDGYDVRTK